MNTCEKTWGEGGASRARTGHIPDIAEHESLTLRQVLATGVPQCYKSQPASKDLFAKSGEH